MKKLLTLIAASTLIASPFAFADQSNDVLQQMPAQNAQQVSDTNATVNTMKPAQHRHHKPHHVSHHHHAKPHHNTNVDAANVTTDTTTTTTVQ